MPKVENMSTRVEALAEMRLSCWLHALVNMMSPGSTGLSGFDTVAKNSGGVN